MQGACVDINSDRVYYETFLMDNRYDDIDCYIFCDELIEYTIYPYVGKMKDVPPYSEDKEAFDMVDILLIDTKTGAMAKVPCFVVDEDRQLFISEKNFNTYWNRISMSMCRCANTKCNEDNKEQVKQVDMNERVDLTYAQKPPKTVCIGKNYKLEYKGVEADLDIQRRISRRASALDDSRIKFVYSKKENCVHDKSCYLVDKIGYMDFEATAELPVDKVICRRCKRDVYIRNAIKQDNKRFGWYHHFFEQCNVGTKDIEKYLADGDMELHMDNINELQVKCNEDTWIIKHLGNAKCELYHNNYVMLGDTERYITSGFHRQKGHYKYVSDMLGFINGYSWEKHLQAKGKLEKEATPEKDIELLVEDTSEQKASIVAEESVEKAQEDVARSDMEQEAGCGIMKNILKAMGRAAALCVAGIMLVRQRKRGKNNG